ncbi:acyl carrier protein [Clostridium acetobutylicum]|uniref:Acyl carrier protein, ACP n=1 Tax=Clostridium acetobutylicum (strain ATCC 824 / DSM 792 / JCM 1419 / IAM 19013 / LMG 5710 / NBRC 13948 / NRRL B-527 / VKM B-1787 / 2291 / W) TaxID=272562 RepID=Q97E07_CLOAB|nr:MULTISPECIES: acyl carrier protein [Clostridium]AAK81245.1 Acyl carrier protein, ACP [Clostridium acetobutylicum ATCC 824]ADZ22353.1 Acyl carrier protein, ACP [Clostridium acetobutylicum EA 2018]AEI32763.1 Acyl carrier protein, ACP [Clostridium acetobutylicum DSM 1731]AWV81085.1 acyl carrier protein [Clostridium acetobutylicum]MBC2395603.1 acyl carrier protein [Clostridium acetobutylicum]
MEQRLIKVVSRTLKEKKERLSLTSSRKSLPKWDSLCHLQIILAVEKEFNINIPMKEVFSIDKIKDFIKFIRSDER